MSRKIKPHHAFTLIELLVVIGIIAILLSIMLPMLAKAKEKTYRVRCISNLKQIYLAMELYLNNNDDTYPCAQDPLPTGTWLWMGRGWRDFLEPYLGGYIDANNPSALFCPADKMSEELYESTSYAYSMSFYHSSEQIDDMNNVADNYSNPRPSICQKRFSVEKPANKVLIGEWLSVHQRIKGQDNGWWCWKGARNYLFADGVVEYLKATQIATANDGNPNPNLTVGGIKGSDRANN